MHDDVKLYGICTDVSSDDEKPVITVDTWLTQAEVKTTFECQEVTSNGYTYPRSVCQFCISLFSVFILENLLYSFAETSS